MKYFEVEMGSFGDTFEERISKISEIGKEVTKDFQVKYKKIQDWFSKYDQLLDPQSLPKKHESSAIVINRLLIKIQTLKVKQQP